MFYEEEAAVPLIVSWKGVTPPGRMDRNHLVSTLDVLPTLCDYAGIQPPPLIRGEFDRLASGVILDGQPGVVARVAPPTSRGFHACGYREPWCICSGVSLELLQANCRALPRV